MPAFQGLFGGRNLGPDGPKSWQVSGPYRLVFRSIDNGGAAPFTVFLFFSSALRQMGSLPTFWFAAHSIRGILGEFLTGIKRHSTANLQKLKRVVVFTK